MPNISRLWRGAQSAGALAAFPLGGWWLYGLERLTTPERMAQGLVIVLPGIDGRSVLSWGVARGLEDGGWPGAVVIHDWTTGFWPLLAYHLCAARRNRACARAIAERIVAYQNEHPGRPVYLVGHSGGGAMALWTLEALPAGRTIAGAVLLGPALSPDYSLGGALARVERGIWNFWSPLDVFILACGTLALGTIDRRHAISAGCRGFRVPRAADVAERELYEERLRQERYRFGLIGRFNLGGHFGCCNRLFVAEEIAPLLEQR